MDLDARAGSGRATARRSERGGNAVFVTCQASQSTRGASAREQGADVSALVPRTRRTRTLRTSARRCPRRPLRRSRQFARESPLQSRLATCAARVPALGERTLHLAPIHPSDPAHGGRVGRAHASRGWHQRAAAPAERVREAERLSRALPPQPVAHERRELSAALELRARSVIVSQGLE